MINMLRRKLTYLIAGSALLLAGLLPSAMAGAAKPYQLPQTAGTYGVPGHAKLKLRVFVYNAKGGNGSHGGSSSPNLICGLADPDSATVDGLTGWRLPAGTWTYHLNTASAPAKVGARDMVSASANAFGAWSATNVGNSVNFARGSDTRTSRAVFDSQNIVSWGTAPNTALAVTYTWYNTTTGVAVEEDTIFNKNFAWDWTDQAVNPGCAYQNYYDAQDILTHELGHWTGLNDNYDTSFADNTMYGYGAPTEVKKNTLTTGDITAVNSLY